MVKEVLNEIVRMLVHSWQSRLSSVLYIVEELVILDLLRKALIGERLEEHMAKFLDTEAAAEEMWKRLLAS